MRVAGKKVIRFLCSAALFGTIAGGTAGCARLKAAASAPATDADIAIAVKDRLQNDPVTRGFSFGVISENNGIVTFHGSVPPDSALRARAVSVALGTYGVVEVVDELYPPTGGIY